jgi:hypothetical protein
MNPMKESWSVLKGDRCEICQRPKDRSAGASADAQGLCASCYGDTIGE